MGTEWWTSNGRSIDLAQRLGNQILTSRTHSVKPCRMLQTQKPSIYLEIRLSRPCFDCSPFPLLGMPLSWKICHCMICGRITYLCSIRLPLRLLYLPGTDAGWCTGSVLCSFVYTSHIRKTFEIFVAVKAAITPSPWMAGALDEFKFRASACFLPRSMHMQWTSLVRTEHPELLILSHTECLPVLLQHFEIDVRATTDNDDDILLGPFLVGKTLTQVLPEVPIILRKSVNDLNNQKPRRKGQ